MRPCPSLFCLEDKSTIGGMETAAIRILPVDSRDRLRVLAESRLLDSLPEDSFDRYTRITAAVLKSEVSLVSLVDADRQFFKSQIGLPPPYDTTRQTPLTHSFCQIVVREGMPLIVEDARIDSRVCDNLAIRDLSVISYLGMPIVSQEGFVFGSLCAINSHPKVWSPADLQMLEDLAHAVSTEVHLRQNEMALRKSVELLREAEERRERSLHMLVHDMRNPAGAILAITELLESSPDGLKTEQRELIGTCRESAENLLSMIRDLLEINNLQSDETVENRDEVAVLPLLLRVARIIQPSLSAARIQLSVDCAHDGVSVSADERQIERVLLNLLSNAGKFSPSGSTISLSARTDWLDGRRGVWFAVQDAGPGVPDAEKEAIFLQYFTGSTAGARGMASFGIGLAFCKMAVEAHRGRIRVVDAPDGGSIFEFFLPAESASV